MIDKIKTGNHPFGADANLMVGNVEICLNSGKELHVSIKSFSD